MAEKRDIRTGPYSKGQPRKLVCPAAEVLGHNALFALAWEVVFQRDQGPSSSRAWEDRARLNGWWQINVYAESAYETKRIAAHMKALDRPLKINSSVEHSLVTIGDPAHRTVVQVSTRSLYFHEAEVDGFSAMLAALPVRTGLILNAAPKLNGEAMRLLRKVNHRLYSAGSIQRSSTQRAHLVANRTVISVEHFEKLALLTLLA